MKSEDIVLAIVNVCVLALAAIGMSWVRYKRTHSANPVLWRCTGCGAAIHDGNKCFAVGYRRYCAACRQVYMDAFRGRKG